MNTEFRIVAIACSLLLVSACGGGSSSEAPAPVPPPALPSPPADTTAPQITLLGEQNIQITAGNAYSDAGATANDNIDGDISSSITLEGTVNIDIPAEYVLTYNVSDAAGNAAQSVERIVTVDAIPLMQVSINTNGGTIVDEPKILSSMQMVEGTQTLYDGNIGIEIRGSSSQLFDKKSFGFETWDEQGEDTNVALAGFPEEEDWIFYGPYSDKSLLRNVLIYDLSNQMERYAVRTKLAELTINNDYRGVYVFMEKIKRDSDRVDISKLKSEDITGGYIIKIDKTTGEDPNLDFFFESKYDGFGNDDIGSTPALEKIAFLYEYPKPEDIEPEEKAYIQTYFADFEEALMSDDFADPDLGYRQYIDVPSFIDFFILNELSHNVDAYRISTFMHKDKGEKLKMGPIWDFNLAFGNANYCRGETTDDWTYRFNTYCPNDVFRVPFWWQRLLEDENFVAELQARWSSLRSDVLADDNLSATIDTHIKRLQHSGAIAKNFDRFSVLGTYVWPNFFIGNTHDEELEYMRTWVTDRVEWMDTAITEL